MKETLFFTWVFLLLTLGLGSTAPIALSECGPKTLNMKIHIYPHPDIENADLQNGVIDINDWPLAKEWIDAWTLMPDKIALRNYFEMSVVQIDMNNQRWPTGSQTSKFYDPMDNQSVKSLELRKAIACLSDRKAIIRDVLGGYGFRADLPLAPFQSEYMDMANYSISGLIHDYNKTRAVETLDEAGFTMGTDGWRINPLTGARMNDLIFYIRQDDPTLRSVGEMLTAEMCSIGIPARPIVAERTTILKIVWVLREYHLYVGGWFLNLIPDHYYDWYSSFLYNSPPCKTPNYVGFCNHEFDEWASKVKYPATTEEAKQAAKQCGRIMLQYCPIVPLYCPKAVKAYQTGWTGVVNNAGYGIDNPYTFLNMNKTGDDTIDWGFKADIGQLNIITTEWLRDREVLGLIYESLLTENPFSLDTTEFLMADSYSVGSWNSTYDSEATVVTFNIRDSVRWHGDNVTVCAEDVSFSFNYTCQCGSEGGTSIAWNYPLVSDINCTSVINSTAIKIHFNHKSVWSINRVGRLPIIRKSIWENVPPNAAMESYDPLNADVNNNGVKDILEDGTGPWTFVDYVKDSYILLKAYDQYYLEQAYVENRLKMMFHYEAGDVDENGVVNIIDLYIMARALGTDAINYPHGNGWGQYSSVCDLNQDGRINALDMCKVAANYGEELG